MKSVTYICGDIMQELEWRSLEKLFSQDGLLDYLSEDFLSLGHHLSRDSSITHYESSVANYTSIKLFFCPFLSSKFLSSVLIKDASYLCDVFNVWSLRNKQKFPSQLEHHATSDGIPCNPMSDKSCLQSALSLTG